MVRGGFQVVSTAHVNIDQICTEGFSKPLFPN